MWSGPLALETRNTEKTLFHGIAILIREFIARKSFDGCKSFLESLCKNLSTYSQKFIQNSLQIFRFAKLFLTTVSMIKLSHFVHKLKMYIFYMHCLK